MKTARLKLSNPRMMCSNRSMRTKTPDLILNYISELYEPQNIGLTSLLERLESHGRLGINIGIIEAQLIKILMRLYQPKKIVECGTLFGYSTIQMARALEKNAHIFTIERDLKAAAQAKISFEECGVADRVTLMIGEVTEKLSELSQLAPFDMIFIDHHKAGYLVALEWAEKNLRQGGLIIADNTLLWGEVAGEEVTRSSKKQLEVMRAFNQALSDSKKYTSILLPTSEGLSIAIKEF